VGHGRAGVDEHRPPNGLVPREGALLVKVAHGRHMASPRLTGPPMARCWSGRPWPCPGRPESLRPTGRPPRRTSVGPVEAADGEVRDDPAIHEKRRVPSRIVQLRRLEEEGDGGGRPHGVGHGLHVRVEPISVVVQREPKERAPGRRSAEPGGRASGRGRPRT
jgi:hypothetical protein